MGECAVAAAARVPSICVRRSSWVATIARGVPTVAEHSMLLEHNEFGERLTDFLGRSERRPKSGVGSEWARRVTILTASRAALATLPEEGRDGSNAFH